mmetsp:Transcript_4347/g.9924  ORF Transcript_4347/g.9924 Transcript_4347/m.9924 type:complete len:247 (+) Transcript_4347:968-1708(+)
MRGAPRPAGVPRVHGSGHVAGGARQDHGAIRRGGDQAGKDFGRPRMRGCHGRCVPGSDQAPRGALQAGPRRTAGRGCCSLLRGACTGSAPAIPGRGPACFPSSNCLQADRISRLCAEGMLDAWAICLGGARGSQRPPRLPCHLPGRGRAPGLEHGRDLFHARGQCPKPRQQVLSTRRPEPARCAGRDGRLPCVPGGALRVGRRCGLLHHSPLAREPPIGPPTHDGGRHLQEARAQGHALLRDLGHE